MSSAAAAPAPLAPQAASTLALELRHVCARAGSREIIHDLSLAVAAGETVAIVGPSGAGKSTLARLALGLIPAWSGSVHVAGRDLTALAARDPRQLRRLRAGMQMIFQDPMRSLDPTQRVDAIITEGLELAAGAGGAATAVPAWGRGRRAWRRDTACQWLVRTGLDAGYYDRYPAQLSGGQRQRVAIARALAMQPALVVADEPVAALDHPTGAHILELLVGLQREFATAYLWVSHNLPQACQFAQRIAVLEAGAIVEIATPAALLAAPRHPCTQRLLAAQPAWPLET